MIHSHHMSWGLNNFHDMLDFGPEGKLQGKCLFFSKLGYSSLNYFDCHVFQSGMTSIHLHKILFFIIINKIPMAMVPWSGSNHDLKDFDK